MDELRAVDTPRVPGVPVTPPPTQLVIRIGQIDRASSDPVLTGGAALYRLIDGRMPVCARHMLELGAYQPALEARAVLAADQIESLVVEFGLRRDDLMALHAPQDPVLGEEHCQLCTTDFVDGNQCHGCQTVLHPQWPAVYCSNTCAHHDA